MKTIACNTYNFEELRDIEAVYVDKTDILTRLIQDRGNKLYFISRPRRFGKSLMISTLECIFRGKRELFKGLKIDSLDYDWQTYPILKFDFSQVPTRSVEAFEQSFKQNVIEALQTAGATVNRELQPADMFRGAINELAQKHGKPVVVLVDEYDAPVGHALDDFEKANTIRKVLSDFYIQIKGNVGNVRFLMMTGVTKFTQLSVFSALNNLTDLTLSPQTATLLGYTEEELSEFFFEHMEAHAQVMGLSYEAYREQLKYWYNGYRFSRRATTTVYNPIAIAQTLTQQEESFIPTWSKTGRPSMLMNYLGRKPTLKRNYEKVVGVDETIFDSANLDALDPITMLYQAGYLTIKDYKNDLYTLGVPNEEVRRDLNRLLLELETQDPNFKAYSMVDYALQEKDFELLETNLKSIYARLPYGAREATFRKAEASYVRIITAILMASGYVVRPEDQQSRGRSDLIAEGPEGIYVFEFKVDKSAAEALAQIREKNYATPYMADARPIFAFGLNFSSETSQLTDFAFEELKR